MNRHFIAFCFSLVAGCIAGQHVIGTSEPLPLFYRHFNIESGLPSNEAYYVYADRENTIWICTDNGVARFDGVQFTSLNEDHGLCSNVIFGCGEDQAGDLWFYSYTGELSRYNREEERFECPEFNEELVRLIRGEVITGMRFEKDTLHVITGSGWVRIWREQLEYRLEHRAPAPGKIFVHILGNGDPIVLAQPDPAATHFDLVMAGRIQDTVHDIPLTFEPGTRISAESDNQGSLFVLFGDDVLVYDTKRQGYRMYRLPFSNSPSVSRLGSRLLCGSFNNGLWRLGGDKDTVYAGQLLHEISVSSAAADWQGGIWASSPTDGLYYIPTGSCYALLGKTTISTEKVRSLLQLGDTVCYMTYDGRLNMVYQADGNVVHDRLLDLSPATPAAIAAGRKVIVRAATPFLYDPSTRKRSLPDPGSPDAAAMRSPVTTMNDTLVMLHASTDGSGAVRSPWSFGRITVRERSPSGGMWLGTIFDLVHADSSGNLRTVGARNGFHRMNVKCLLTVGHDSVLVGTSQGLHLVHKERILFTLTVADGLSGGKVLSLARKGDVLYVGTARGIDRIEGIFSADRRVTSLSRVHGVPVCPATHLAFAGDHLVAGTDYGIFAFRLKDPAAASAPVSVKFTQFSAGDERHTVTGAPVHLGHRENSLKVSFVAMNFRNALHNLFRYKLYTAGDDEWQYTSGNSVAFPELVPGTYTLFVQALNPDGGWSDHGATLPLILSPPVWQRPWFLALGAAALLLLSYVVFRLRIRRLRQMSDIRNKLSEARMQALGMQLRPHFMYNALNAVSYHMARNDAKVTLRFLGKFARLMRSVFRNSQQVLIPIEEELEALRLYIEMEAVRLGSGLEYAIIVEDGLDVQACRIPSLILQPVVENAIWHGVGATGGEGRVEIMLTRSGDVIEITVSDNGPGPGQANGSSKKEKHSLDILRERVLLMGNHYHCETSLQVLDRMELTGTRGTLVRIRVPVVMEDELKTAHT